MALRYLARAAISTLSALQLAPPGPRVALSSAGSRPVASSHSSHQQLDAAMELWGGVRKKKEKQTERSIAAEEERIITQYEVLELKRTVVALRECLNKERRRERFDLGSATLAVGIYVACDVQGQRVRQMEIKRLLSELEKP
ncbi:unnamed protein product [Urochloa decumbens]|uniref:Uncharacterized protein n=1 Tax=Urochloa decumbens TaxID=240449 RepID=A0ABC9FNT8_9POAL